MMASELLAKVEAVLCKVDIAEASSFFLVIRNREVCCIPIRSKNVDDILICTVNRLQILIGFTGKEWDDILTKMIQLQKEGLI